MIPIEAMAADGLVPLYSSGDPDNLYRVAEAVSEAGISTLEVTLRNSGSLAAFGEFMARIGSGGPDLTVGVGTVFDSGTADTAIAMGAQFVFSPVVTAEVAERCQDQRVPYIPGCATPTEIHAALELGCETVKLFPADTIGGSGFLRAIRAVFPNINAIPSGGVVPQEEVLADWYRSGATAVGVGSWLFPSEAIAGDDWAEVKVRLTTAVNAVAAARKDPA